MNLKVNSQYNSLTVPSNITDVIFSTVNLHTYVFTTSQSVYDVNFSSSGVSSGCFSMDFDPKITNETTLSLKQDVFWYITDLGAVKGRDLTTLNLVYSVTVTKAVEL